MKLVSLFVTLSLSAILIMFLATTALAADKQATCEQVASAQDTVAQVTPPQTASPPQVSQTQTLPSQTLVPQDSRAQSTSDAKTVQATPVQNLSIDFRYKQGQTPPAPNQYITDDNGNSYRLVLVDQAVPDPTYARIKKPYYQDLTKDIAIADVDRVRELFPDRVSIADGYFVGEIGLAANAFEKRCVYESFTGQVDKHYTVKNLADNDVTRLASTMDFTVRSDLATDATQIKTLALLAVEYEITATNELGLPIEYAAHCTYRGEESWLELHHYQVVAHYAGDVTSGQDQYMFAGHYELVIEPDVVTKVELKITEPAIPAAIASEKAAFPFLPVITASIFLIGLILLFWRFWSDKNARLFEHYEEQASLKKLLCKRHVKLKGGEAIFVVPSSIKISPTGNYVIELGKNLAVKKGMLKVVWQDTVIATAALSGSIALDIKEQLVLSSLPLLGHTSILGSENA